MSEKVLKRNDFEKYVGVSIDKKLACSVHINKFPCNWLNIVQCCIKFVTMYLKITAYFENVVI